MNKKELTLDTSPVPFTESIEVEIEEGQSLKNFLINMEIPEDLWDRIIFMVNGEIKALEYIMRESDSIKVLVIPAGGDDNKGILGSILMAAITVVATVYLGPAVGGGLYGAMAVSAVTIVGGLLVGALIKPPNPTTNIQESESANYNVSGQSNYENKYGSVMKAYGRNRVYPAIGATSLIENVGGTSNITTLYDFGYGAVGMEDFQIGESNVNIYNPKMIIHYDSLLDNTDPLQLLNKKVSYQTFAYKLNQYDPLTITTELETKSATLDLSFNRGLVQYNTSGDRLDISVTMLIRYRKVGDIEWINVPTRDFTGCQTETNIIYNPHYIEDVKYAKVKLGWTSQSGNVTFYENGTVNLNAVSQGWKKGAFVENVWEYDDMYGSEQYGIYKVNIPDTNVIDATKLTNHTAEPFVVSVEMYFDEFNQYEINIARLTESVEHDRVFTDCHVTLLKSFGAEQILNLQHKQTMVEMKIKATEQISGVIQNFSALCTSFLRTHDGTQWLAPQPSRNPAWIVLDILTNPISGAPLNDEQIDFASFVKLAEICDEQITVNVGGENVFGNRYYCDFIIDTEILVQELISNILSIARSQIMISSNGKYGVFTDTSQQIPVQLLTPRNSWGFNGSRSFTDKVHAFKVKFIDPQMSWQKNEIMVYNDGYDITNAEIFEDLETLGITDYWQAWRYGRYMMAQGIHRSETFTVRMDIENIVMQRGDLVVFQHQIPKTGGLSCRIVSVSNTVVVLDQQFELTANSYFTLRSQSGEIIHGDIILSTNNSIVIDTGIQPLTPDTDLLPSLELLPDAGIGAMDINAGDLIVIGEKDIYEDQFIIQSIVPEADLTAEITMVKYVEGIYDVDTLPIPKWDPGFGTNVISSTNIQVDNLSVEVTREYNSDREPISVKTLTWNLVGEESSLSRYDIYVVQDGVQDKLLISQANNTYIHYVNMVKDVDYMNDFYYKVIPFNTNGIEGGSGTVFVPKDISVVAPEAVDGFFVNVEGSSTTLSWSANRDNSIKSYEVRYTPDTETPTWDKSQKVSSVDWSIRRLTIGTRLGTYMIKSINVFGTVSDVRLQRTNILTIPNIDIVQSIDETGAYVGNKENCVIDGTSLKMDVMGAEETYSYYYFDNFTNNGSIFEMKLSNYLESYAWNELEDAYATHDDYDVLLQYRTADELTPISSWNTLAEIPIIGGAFEVEFTDWATFEVGNIVGNQIQYRIKMVSRNKDVRVYVSSARIEIDVPEVIQADRDLIIPSNGVRIYFNPSFYSTPSINVTVDGTSTPSLSNSIEVTNKNSLGFDLIIKDENGIGVEAQIDYNAVGYGRTAASIPRL